MNPEQALQILIQLAEQAAVPKMAHVQAEQAFKVLQQFIIEKTEKKDVG